MGDAWLVGWVLVSKPRSLWCSVPFLQLHSHTLCTFVPGWFILMPNPEDGWYNPGGRCKASEGLPRITPYLEAFTPSVVISQNFTISRLLCSSLKTSGFVKALKHDKYNFIVLNYVHLYKFSFILFFVFYFILC